MSVDNPLSEEPPFFSAVLRPHRSLGPRGFLLLMAVTSLLCFAAGTVFWRLGAWPVTGFLGLDVLLVYLAFRASYRAARAYDEVKVGPSLVLLRQVSARGAVREVRFNPFWVRMEVDREPDEGVTRLALRSHGRAYELGRFLDPDGRGAIAEQLGAALAAARAGHPIMGRSDAAAPGADRS